MRFLHTADWHLGRQIRGRSRVSEFEAVLTEIKDIAVSEDVDVVLVAGDIWDTNSPSPESDRLLFSALREFVAHEIEVVLIAGNHDSAHKLDAIGKLSELLNVHTQAYVKGHDKGGIIRITRDNVQAEIAAIPWIPDGKALDAIDVLSDTVKNRGIYQDFVEGIYKNVVKGYTSNSVHLLMGHVFVDGALLADIEGSERRLHIDVAYGVDKARLPQEPQYLALGHIHHPQEILGTPNGSAAYAGSILQLDFGEREQQKIVRIIDLELGLPAKPRLIPLTSGKPLVELKGTPEEVLAKSEKNENKNAYIRAVLEVDAPEPGMAQKMRDSAAGIVDIRLDYDRIEENISTVSLQDLKPEELFVRYYQEQHGTIPSDELLALFREILGEVVSTE